MIILVIAEYFQSVKDNVDKIDDPNSFCLNLSLYIYTQKRDKRNKKLFISFLIEEGVQNGVFATVV